MTPAKAATRITPAIAAIALTAICGYASGCSSRWTSSAGSNAPTLGTSCSVNGYWPNGGQRIKVTFTNHANRVVYVSSARYVLFDSSGNVIDDETEPGSNGFTTVPGQWDGSGVWEMAIQPDGGSESFWTGYATHGTSCRVTSWQGSFRP